MTVICNWIMSIFGAEKLDGAHDAEAERQHDAAPHKWLPVIAHDYCTGCAQCLEACDHGCLGMVWEFATLLRPGDCGSEGNCMDACPEDVIRMEWVSTEGEVDVGRWREAASGAVGVTAG